MTLYGAIGISASGIDAAQTWINTNAGNIANMDDTASTSQAAYAEQTPVFAPVTASGLSGDAVEVSSIQLGSSAGTIEQDPSSPLANAQGQVRVPDISLSNQMVGLIEAQNDYQANATALSQAKTAYQSALSLGH